MLNYKKTLLILWDFPLHPPLPPGYVAVLMDQCGRKRQIHVCIGT